MRARGYRWEESLRWFSANLLRYRMVSRTRYLLARVSMCAVIRSEETLQSDVHLSWRHWTSSSITILLCSQWNPGETKLDSMRYAYAWSTTFPAADGADAHGSSPSSYSNRRGHACSEAASLRWSSSPDTSGRLRSRWRVTIFCFLPHLLSRHFYWFSALRRSAKPE